VSGPVTGNREPRGAHQSGTVLGLCSLEMKDHAMQVVIEPGCQLFAHPPDFLKELVLHDADFTISSRGVQITGISNPAC
jgi:hypothetical protein